MLKSRSLRVSGACCRRQAFHSLVHDVFLADAKCTIARTPVFHGRIRHETEISDNWCKPHYDGARIRLMAGDRKGALELLEESWNVSREASTAFVGPVVLGAIALATDDPGRRSEALRQGEAILREGCASHNHFRFYRDAIEVSLRERLWEDAEYYAAALERYFGAQSSAWSDFIIGRGRALAEAGNERPSPQAKARLRQLRDRALTVGMIAAVPQLDEALGESVSQL